MLKRSTSFLEHLLQYSDGDGTRLETATLPRPHVAEVPSKKW